MQLESRMKKLKISCLIALILIPASTFASGSNVGFHALICSPLTMVFILANVALTIYFTYIKFDRFAVVHGPEILTTVGIFGCFLGIAMSLLYFDSTNLTTSVPMLLEGIKTAFWASVSGVAGALAIRIRHNRTKSPIPQSNDAAKAASIDDLVDSIVSLQKGLIGDEEGTLLSQIKLLRQDSNDQLQKLRESFSNFSKHMVENNQKAIIEALREVISDFNENLTDQFGDNFKQLNEGVKQLVVWQDQYKRELDIIKDYQMQASENMSIATDAFTRVVDRAESFTLVTNDLKDIISLMEKQSKTLFDQENALAQLLIEMKDVTPQFAIKLESMIDQISSGVTKVQSETREIVRNFGEQARSANSEMKELLGEVVNKTQKQLLDGLTDSSKIIRDGVITLDKELQKGLNDSLSSLGKQLASLSEKFVSDYLPLTERLREVVKIANSTRG
jgi:hypothetical protein